MSDIYRGTTHSFEFDMETDLSAVSVMWVTLSQNGMERVTKETEDIEIDGQTVKVNLTQEDTLALKPNRVAKLQIRILMDDGSAEITETIKRNVKDCLKDGVIGNEDS